MVIWVFPKIGGVSKWMVKIMEKPIKMDDLGVPLFLETPIFEAGGTFSKAHHFGVLPPLVFGGVMDLLVDISNLSWSPQICGSLNAGKKTTTNIRQEKLGG